MSIAADICALLTLKGESTRADMCQVMKRNMKSIETATRKLEQLGFIREIRRESSAHGRPMPVFEIARAFSQEQFSVQEGVRRGRPRKDPLLGGASVFSFDALSSAMTNFFGEAA